MCVDASGNIVNNVMEFRSEEATGEFHVQKLGILDTVNTFQARVVTTTGIVDDPANGLHDAP